ncbi:serine/threonine-protein kinase [Streptomyces tubercidicus]|uniref:serine/threonine-protein kinase n=1 Tax=Streptomyces tubercidicus TaxID=47759 RepID=UPI0036BC9C90
MIAGRYELVKRLGRGGMGEVWAGRDRTLHRDVAIKILVPGNPALQELSWRFEREAVAAAQISHPNVVAHYDRGVHEDVLFLVMEKVEGATLSEHIRDKSPMDPTSALTIAQGICAAFIAAHRAGVIHYDIKPHNVMLAADGQVKVVDFGIAGFIQTAFTLARSSQLTPAGTIEYGAPEQFLSERGDERSDLYALGSVLFAMLTGRAPFTGQFNAMAILRRKLDEDAPRIDSLRLDLSPALTILQYGGARHGAGWTTLWLRDEKWAPARRGRRKIAEAGVAAWGAPPGGEPPPPGGGLPPARPPPPPAPPCAQVPTSHRVGRSAGLLVPAVRAAPPPVP